MELIVFVIVLSCVGVLAMRFGYDSRIPAPSKEHDLAKSGVSWDDQPSTTAGDGSREAPVSWLDPSAESARPRLAIPLTFFRMLRELVG